MECTNCNVLLDIIHMVKVYSYTQDDVIEEYTQCPDCGGRLMDEDILCEEVFRYPHVLLRHHNLSAYQERR